MDLTQHPLHVRVPEVNQHVRFGESALERGAEGAGGGVSAKGMERAHGTKASRAGTRKWGGGLGEGNAGTEHTAKQRSAERICARKKERPLVLLEAEVLVDGCELLGMRDILIVKGKPLGVLGGRKRRGEEGGGRNSSVRETARSGARSSRKGGREKSRG